MRTGSQGHAAAAGSPPVTSVPTARTSGATRRFRPCRWPRRAGAPATVTHVTS